MARTHAILSPSSSHRWLNCTPSARLEENVEDRGSEFAEEGTCAHALCECKLKHLLGVEDEECLREFRELRDKWYNNEMEACTDDYVSTVWNKYQTALKTCPTARLLVEEGISFTAWIPESFGTADALIITDETMEVVDFKYGKGVEVSAVENPQMAIYALGCLADYDIEYDIKKVRMTIIQPRMNNISEWEVDAKELKKWADTILKTQASIAWKGEGDPISGPWCKFCKVKARCSTLANDAIACYTQHPDKHLISDDEMAVVLDLIPAIKSWCSGVEDYATAKAISGTKWKGYKLVEGKSYRKITDTESLVANLLPHVTDEEALYKPRELRAIGELEKLVGKKVFFEASRDCIEKPAGKPTLVPESDKRQELNTTSAEEDFKNIQV